MFSCSFKNGTTIEWRMGVSLDMDMLLFLRDAFLRFLSKLGRPD